MPHHKKLCQLCKKRRARHEIITTNENTKEILFHIQLCDKCYEKKKNELEIQQKEIAKEEKSIFHDYFGYIKKLS